jgi:predicted O-methyltransferase YrrM
MDQKNNLSLLKNLFNNRYFSTIAEKVFKRFFDKKSSISETELLAWLEDNESKLEDYCKAISEELWQESLTACAEIKKESEVTLAKIPHDLGGGGAYPLLYFLVRKLAPKVVVESGVAAGFSSHSILKALKQNDSGSLYSSDFPYFRIASPEKYIGVLVPERLKSRWQLFIKGDRKNFPLILKNIDHIDILHYDSDKSYSGRSFALKTFRKVISPKTVLIFDDIQDNSHFYDFVKANNPSERRVFSFENKWLGVIGQV